MANKTTRSTSAKKKTARFGGSLGKQKLLLRLAAVAFVLIFAVVGEHIYRNSFAATQAKQIRSALGNYCITSQNDSGSKGNPVNTATCDGRNAEHWEVSGNLLKFGDVAGMCAQPRNGFVKQSPIVVGPCSQAASAGWQWQSWGGLELFQSKAKDADHLCLTVPNGSASGSPQLQIRVCVNTNSDQKWNQQTAVAPVSSPSSCGNGWNGHASPAVAQCVGKILAGNIWNLNATRNVSCGEMGQPCGKSLTNWACLQALWNHESGWRWNASNASGAYGIPQSLPGSKMAVSGADWHDNAATQIKWGLSYIKTNPNYGNPCIAWQHEQGLGWYVAAPAK